MTTPVGVTRHTGVSSRRYKGVETGRVWNLPDDAIGLVYQYVFLPIFASLVVWERTSFVSALISFIIFHLSDTYRAAVRCKPSIFAEIC